MSEKKISRYPVPEIEELPEDLQETMRFFEEKKGFIPNVHRALSHRPDELRGFLTYSKSLMLTQGEGGLTTAEKEMIVVAHSAHNGCAYCVASHGAVLRVASGDPTMSQKIATNYREADITPRQEAMIDFAMKVNSDSRSISEADFKTLRGHGFTDEDIWDIAAITSFFNMSNRMMNLLAVHPDERFYSMGR